MKKKIIASFIIGTLTFFSISFDVLLLPQFAVAQTAPTLDPSSPNETSNPDGTSETLTGKILNPDGASIIIDLEVQGTITVVSELDPTLDSSGNYTAIFTGLTPNTVYEYKIKSHYTSTIIADYSSSRAFTTSSVVGGAGNFTSAVDSSSITNVSAVVTGNGGSVALPGTDIDIRVGTSTNIATQDITTSTTVNTDGSFSFTIPSELLPGTTYDYSIADSETDPTFTGASVTSATGSFTTTGTNASAPVVVTNLVANANSDGTSINFTATASTSDSFDFSFICATSTSMVHPETQTFSADSTTLPNVSGSLDLTTPISTTVPYYCEIIDSTSRILTSERTVTRASGALGNPFVIGVTASSATIGINFASSTTVTDAPTIYYGDGSTDETNEGGDMSSSSTSPNNYVGTITGLSSSTTYFYAVMDSDNNPYGGSTNNSFKTSVPPPIVPVISGDYTAVDTSSFDSSSGQGIVRCKGGLSTGVTVVNGVSYSNGQQLCGFPELMDMVNRIIKYLVFVIAPIICAGILMYGGFLYATSGGSSEDTGKAKSMFKSAIYGWLIALIAWILVKFIMQSLGYDETIFPTFW